MGSGKSTHGRKLANALKVPYVDLDIYVSRKLNKTIPEIFEKFGEHYFRDQETEALKDIIEEKKEPTVISLGGGAICFNDNVKLVKENGLVIYLETHENILRQRLMRSKNKRPHLKDMNEEEVLSFIKTKVNERSKFYDQAHIKINALNLTTAILIKALEEYYEK